MTTRRRRRAMRNVVADASPLIALAKIDSFSLLRQLFGRVVVTEAVRQEVVRKPDVAAAALEAGVAAGWIVVAAEEPMPTRMKVGPGPGEAATLTHAIRNNADMVLMDDRPARSHAARHGVPVMGVLGILLLAKRSGFVTAIAPLIERLVQTSNFRVSQELIRGILVDAGEA